MVQRLLLAGTGVVFVAMGLALVVHDAIGSDTGTFALAGPPAPTTDVATSPRVATRSPTAPTRGPSATPTAPPTPTPSSQVPAVGRGSGRLADRTTPTAAPAPTRLHLPGLDLDLPIVAVGVTADGQMEVPGDIDDAGWYRYGPRPGEPGNAVVAGHVDDRVQGLGAFRRLVELDVGDDIRVDAADGTTSAWRVTARRTIAKGALDADELFRRSGVARLVLVTCGGEFDATVRSYRSNVVVVADLL